MGYTNVASHEKYDFLINKEAKSLRVNVKGYYSEADRLKFAAEYKKICDSIKPSEYELIVDCTTMETSDDSMVEKLGGVFVIYQQTGFNPIKVVKSKSAIAHSQLRKAIKNVGVPVEFISE